MKREEKPAKRWQDNKEFCAFLKRAQYDGCLSDGLYLYMYEAWCAALAHVSRSQP